MPRVSTGSPSREQPDYRVGVLRSRVDVGGIVVPQRASAPAPARPDDLAVSEDSAGGRGSPATSASASPMPRRLRRLAVAHHDADAHQQLALLVHCAGDCRRCPRPRVERRAPELEVARPGLLDDDKL